MAFDAINPATGEKIRSYEEHSAADAARLLENSARRFESWRSTSTLERAMLMEAVAKTLEARKEDLASLMAEEMGKPVVQGRAEVDKCAWVCRYYAEHGETLLAPEMVMTEAAKSYIDFQPLGTVLALMPWNFPLWQVFRCAAPAITAGNAVALKHAANVPGCALAIEEIFLEAGAPEGLFTTLMIGIPGVPALIGHPAVRGVALTGSTAAGRSVAAEAGKHLKKCVLELGGSDPYLVLDDADAEAAAKTCAASRLINAGQSCIAAKRFIVTDGARLNFERRFVEHMADQKVGDPADEATTVGPLARKDLQKSVHAQVERSVKSGARLLLGGKLPDGPGAFYPPTVLTDVRPGMAAFDEEIFGPAAAVIPAKDEAEAVRLANLSPYGLGAAVFTRDNARGERVASRIDAGSVFINSLVRSDPRLPFGGIKDSGYGRELSEAGLKEFVNVKTIVVQ